MIIYYKERSDFMGLFGSKVGNHLDGHKGLTKHEEVLVIGAPKGHKQYFPTLAPNKTVINFNVKPGDKVLKGQKIGERSDFYVPIYSSVSGIVLDNENIFSPVHNSIIPHIVIESDGLDNESKPLKTVSLDDSQEAIMEAMKEAGLVGMGGAGFPTYIKYAHPENIDTLIVNGVECEPYLTTDFLMMQEEPHRLIEGINLLLKAFSCTRAIIAIKVKKPEVVEKIKPLIDIYPYIDLVEVPDIYPMGWERVLIKQILKREYNKLPSEAGVIVNNAQTIINLATTLLEGKVITERLVTVSGNAIKNPHNIRCRIGTLASELIETCGGYTEEEITLIPGGPMCGKAVNNDRFAILIPNGALTVLKHVKYKTVACLRCGTCTNSCPAGLQPVELKRAFESKDVDRMLKLDVMACIECGTCSYVCPSKIDVTDYVKKCKALARLRK